MESNHRPLDRQAGTLTIRPPLPTVTHAQSAFFVSLTFALHSTRFDKVVISSTSVAFLAKGWTLFPIKGVFSATELALGMDRDDSSNFRAALPRRNPFVGLDLQHLVLQSPNRASAAVLGTGSWSQTTVENCIGGHVNVLSDYKKT